MTYVKCTLDTVLYTGQVDVESALIDLSTHTSLTFLNTLFLDAEHGSGAWLQAPLLAQVAGVDAGLDCRGSSAVLLRSRLGPGLLSAATSASEEMGTRMV